MTICNYYQYNISNSLILYASPLGRLTSVFLNIYMKSKLYKIKNIKYVWILLIHYIWSTVIAYFLNFPHEYPIEKLHSMQQKTACLVKLQETELGEKSKRLHN